MDTIAPLQGGPGLMAAPPPVADLRPTADAAAVARDPLPETPVPVQSTLPPPSSRQIAEVGRTLLASSLDGTLQAPRRVLKPYGIEMLPRAKPDEPPPERPEPIVGPEAEDAKEAETARTGQRDVLDMRPVSDQLPPAAEPPAIAAASALAEAPDPAPMPAQAEARAVLPLPIAAEREER